MRGQKGIPILVGSDVNYSPENIEKAEEKKKEKG